MTEVLQDYKSSERSWLNEVLEFRSCVVMRKKKMDKKKSAPRSGTLIKKEPERLVSDDEGACLALSVEAHRQEIVASVEAARVENKSMDTC